MIKYCVNDEFIANGYAGNVVMKIASAKDNTQSYLTEHFCPHTYDVDTSIFVSITEEDINKHFTMRRKVK